MSLGGNGLGGRSGFPKRRNAAHALLRWRVSRVRADRVPVGRAPGLRHLVSDAAQRLWMSITGSSSGDT